MSRKIDYRIAIASIFITAFVYVVVGNISENSSTDSVCQDVGNVDSIKRYASALEVENARLNKLLGRYRKNECVKECARKMSSKDKN